MKKPLLVGPDDALQAAAVDDELRAVADAVVDVAAHALAVLAR